MQNTEEKYLAKVSKIPWLNVCIEISERYEINFLEIGNDEDHVHFLVQSVPKMTVTRMVQIIKSITAREVFAKHPEVKK